jgi:hypothetical protein
MSYTNGLDKPTDYFNTKLYTGTGSSNAITGVGFQPDWVWIKCRDDTHNHQVFDSVRGVHKRMRTDTDGAETESSESLKSFDSDGYTLGTEANVNNPSNTFASWNWLASNTTASNTDGSITSTVSANTTSGFSIVSYTGTGANATVGHGLNAVPKVFIIKNRSAIAEWAVYHESLTNAEQVSLFLDLDSAVSGTSSVRYNNTAPTSSVFSLGSGSLYNGSSNNMIAYCFAEKKGFSKFGSYTGNGSTDGTFVYTGFKPAFVIFKRTDGVIDWVMLDNKREPSNDGDFNSLWPNLSDSEGAYSSLDILSNGFKIRNTASEFNASGGSYIYMCFAEAPFTTSTGIPTTAR